MKLLACCALLACVAMPTHAFARTTSAPALTLAWGDCLPAAGASTAAFGCATNTITFSLFPAFTLAVPVDSVVALEGVIDILSQADPLPTWWNLQPGGCRDNALVASIPAGSGCFDPWGGNGVALLQAYRVSPQTPTPDRARIVFVTSVTAAQAAALAAGRAFYAAELDLSTRATIGTNICSGCSATACLVFNSLTLRRLPGAVGPDVTISDPSATTNWAFWQGSTGLDCASVPVHNRTWGAIKSLYR